MIVSRFKYSVWLLLLINLMLRAQSSTDTLQTLQADYRAANFFNYLGNDFKTAVTAPADFTGGDWLTAAAIGGSLAAVFIYDEKISAKIRSHKNQAADLLTETGNVSGEAIVVAPFLASVWLTGYLTDNQQLQKTFFYSLETLALSAVFTQAIKYSAGRARPYLDLGSDEFIGFNKKGDYNSFPSGHTQTAFAVAAAFAMEYGDNLWVVIPAYTLAATTAYARVRDNKHWPSDVFAGAVISYLSAKAVRKAHQDNNRFSLGLTHDYTGKPALAVYYNF